MDQAKESFVPAPKNTPWRDSIWSKEHERLFRFRNCEHANKVHVFELMSVERWRERRRDQPLRVIFRRLLYSRPAPKPTARFEPREGEMVGPFWRKVRWHWDELAVADIEDGRIVVDDPGEHHHRDDYEPPILENDFVVVGVGFERRDNKISVLDECDEAEAIRRVLSWYDDPHPAFTAKVADGDPSGLRSIPGIQCVDCACWFEGEPEINAGHQPAFHWSPPGYHHLSGVSARNGRLHKDLFWPTYNAYLKSEEWANKRGLVFRRAQDRCEACLEAAAEEVHHLTYDHVFDEPLFDLAAVCRPCHDRITAMDREGRRDDL